MNIFDKLFNRFPAKFPKTTDLLLSATGDVFPAFCVGVSVFDEKENDFKNFFYHSKNCTLNSLFDLASLTKVICTTSVVAVLEEKQKISIEEKVSYFFERFQDKRVRLTHLLDHSSGLPAYLDMHNLFHEKDGMRNFDPRITPKLARRRFETEIIKSHHPDDFEKKVIYSDLGFMLLGWALEKKMNVPLDALFQEYVAKPLELHSIQFLPTTFDVLPTEYCPWRKRILKGEVHDENCYILGGVAGHAGLFGNVKDVLKFGVSWLKAYHSLQKTFIEPKTAKKYFTQKNIKESVRSLGWDGVSSENSSTGHYFSKNSRGHLGFTGTSLWIDPEKKLVVTLLTNRVHPTRQNEKIKSFRPLFHDTLLKELGYFS